MPPDFLLTKWQRNTFLAFDTFLAASGLIILSLGMTYHVSYTNTTFDVEDKNTDTAAILLVIVGFISFPVAYFGFFAAVKGQSFLIRACSFAVLGLAIITILTGLLFVYAVSSLKSSLRDRSVAVDRWTNRREHMVFWNTMHFLLECCGYETGAAGWLPNLPSSCCYQQTYECKLHNAYRRDCEDVCCNGATGYMNGYVSLVIGLLELVGAFFIFALYWFTIGVSPPTDDSLEKTLEKL